MTQSDKSFIRAFGGVLVVLFLITIGVAIAANSVPNPVRDSRESDPRLMLLESERIKPVGKVNTGDVIIAAAAPAKSSASAEPRSGEEVYNIACGACHASGVAGAPKTGDKAAWAPRMAKGMETLVANAINGIGAMPAKGGNPTISDAEIKATVEYMTVDVK